MSVSPVKSICIFVLGLLFCERLFAHNGSVAYAYPLGKIMVDGDLSDWPKDAVKYKIAINPSDTKPRNESDFSGYFRLFPGRL